MSRVVASALSTCSATPAANQMASRLSQKLAYEWKNVYRKLGQHETYPKGHGLVTRPVFERILGECNV